MLNINAQRSTTLMSFSVSVANGGCDIFKFGISRGSNAWRTNSLRIGIPRTCNIRDLEDRPLLYPTWLKISTSKDLKIQRPWIITRISLSEKTFLNILKSHSEDTLAV